MKSLQRTIAHSFAWILLLTLTSLSGLSAAAIVDVDFNNMTAGQQVVVQAPGVEAIPVVVASSATLPTGSSGTIYSDFASTNSPFTPFGDGNVLVLDRSSGTEAAIVSFEANPANRITSGVVSISFDLMIDNRTSPARTGNLFLSVRNGSYNTISSFTLASNGTLTLNGYSAPGTAISNAIVGVLSLATSYEIELRLDYGSGMAQTYINGLALGDTQAFSTTGGVIGMSLSTSSATVGRWAFDDVVVAAVPEPSTMTVLASMLLISGLLRLVRRRPVL